MRTANSIIKAVTSPAAMVLALSTYSFALAPVAAAQEQPAQSGPIISGPIINAEPGADEFIPPQNEIGPPEKTYRAVTPPRTNPIAGQPETVSSQDIQAPINASEKPPIQVDLSADDVTYDSILDRIIASGNVVLMSENRTAFADKIIWERRTGKIFGEGKVRLEENGRTVRADDVVWDNHTGKIVGSGNVRLVDESGNQLYTSGVELTDKFEAGAMEDILLALREGGRLAAKRGKRGKDGSVMLETAAYSACAVTDTDGCDKDPSWRITADQVDYNETDKTIRFKGAYLELFGRRVLPMPGLSIRTDGEAVSGFLIPGFRVSESNGVEVTGRYYRRIAENRDLGINTHIYTKARPLISTEWRHLMKRGAYQITAYGTHSSRVSDITGEPKDESDFRGYLAGNGRFQLDPNWSITGSVRLASDRTFLRRYDISRDDRLRSTVNLERIDESSYFSLAGWATQTLRLNQEQGSVPLALPVLDFRHRITSPTGLGGVLEVQANSLAITRNEGQDTQRAFAGARWDLRRLTPLGQMVTLTGLVRGDVYHSDENDLTPTLIYQGKPRWVGRGIALGAIDVQWPFVGEAFGGTQVFSPHIQLVATPQLRNLAIPNEDSRAFDLEDSNLFALNRFPGYDRFEDGIRLTYGMNWELQRPRWQLRARIGQSYRFEKDPSILVDGTGLSERISDFTGRTEIQYRDFFKFTHRYRLDKDSFAIRRNEVDATIGSQKTYAEIGYLRLNRNIAEGIEDLQDREELRVATRIAFAKYWSVFGSGVFNLTDAEEDPFLTSDGFEPIRTRLGIAYRDDCLEMGLTWRRDYITSGDAQRGNTFQLYFALRNFGFQ